MNDNDMGPVPDYIIDDALKSPMNWNKGGKVHNWRNHVWDRTREIWDTFSREQKLAIAGDANDRASHEEWD